MTTLHEAEEVLPAMDLDNLREMGYELARSHISGCELTSQIADCPHISPTGNRDGVDGLTADRLATLLAPTALVATDPTSVWKGDKADRVPNFPTAPFEGGRRE